MTMTTTISTRTTSTGGIAKPLAVLGLLSVLTLLLAGRASGQTVPHAAVDGSAACAAGKQAIFADGIPPTAAPSGASLNFDATYYHLTLGLTADPDYLTGTTRIEGRAQGTTLHTLALDLDDTMQVTTVRTPAGTPLAFSHADDVLTITLPAAVPAGEAVAVEVSYEGVPEQDGLGTFSFDALGRDQPIIWTLSQPYGARAWWPCKDHPSDKADSVRVTVTVPEGLRVGSNGLLRGESTDRDGRTTFDWHSGYPIATYLVSFAAGPYEVLDQTYTRPDSLAAHYGALQLPILHYAYPGSGVLGGWQQVTDVFPVLEHWFGPYPFPEEKYGHAQFTFSGGMEHQTMSSMGSGWIGLVVHELAHQWYGDLITMATWPHLWLNEGFATYAELLYYEARPDAYAGTYEQVFELYWDRARGADGTLIVQDTLSVSNLFSNNRVYAKGGMVLHMLRHVLGEDAFRTTLQTYAADTTLRFGTARTADFQQVAEAVSGQDLATFFQQWVTQGTGYPVYDVGWSSAVAESGYEVMVDITQTQTDLVSNVEVFEMPVTLLIQTAAGPERFTVLNDRRTQRYTFSVAARPTGVVFDPDRALLRNDPVVATRLEAPPEAAATLRLDAVYPNPTRQALTIRLTVPEATPVRLALYDVLGRERARLHDAVLPAGSTTLPLSLPDVPAGFYTLYLIAADRTVTHPVVVSH